jgi:hypothetical protein
MALAVQRVLRIAAVHCTHTRARTDSFIQRKSHAYCVFLHVLVRLCVHVLLSNSIGALYTFFDIMLLYTLPRC